MKCIFKIFGLIFIVFISTSCSKDVRPDRPNILFICIDDFRPQLAAYGENYMVTPHMDDLAHTGRLFINQYVAVPTCGPSRYSLLTGKYPRNKDELQNNVFDQKLSVKKSYDQPESFIELFKNNGYYTVGIGKISHTAGGVIYDKNEPGKSRKELPKSWSEFYTEGDKWGTGHHAILAYADGESRESLKRQVKPYEKGEVEDDGYPDGLLAKQAIHQLKELGKSEHPFFLAIGFFKPHLPFTAPAKYWDLYNEDSISLTKVHNIPENTSRASFHSSGEFRLYKKGDEKPDLDHEMSSNYSRKIRHAYYASVSYVDAQIGKVIDALRKIGLSENTVIVVWGDHGWQLGDQRVWGKHTLSEYSLRSTLIIKTPKMQKAGVSTDAIVESIDIFPTLLDLIGLEVPGSIDGKSFKDILDDPYGNSDGMAFSYFNRGISLRTSRYRLTKYYRKQEPTIELYDYENDPYESVNIAGAEPLIVDSLLGFWEVGDQVFNY